MPSSAPSPHPPFIDGKREVSLLAEVPQAGEQSGCTSPPGSVLLLPPRWPLWAQLGRGRPPRVSSRLGALRPAQSRACAAGESGSAAHRFRAHGVARGQTKASISTHRLRHLARPQDRSGRRCLHGHLSRAEVSRRSREAPGLLGSRVVGAVPCPYGIVHSLVPVWPAGGAGL